MKVRRCAKKAIAGILVFAMVITCMVNAVPAFMVRAVAASGDPAEISVTHNGKFDFGTGTVEEGYTQVKSSNLYEEGTNEYGFEVVQGSIGDYGIGGTGNLMNDAVRLVFADSSTAGIAKFIVELEPGTYDIKLGTGNSGNYSTTFRFKNASGDTLCEPASYTESATYNDVERKGLEINDGKLVLEIESGKTRFASIGYLDIVKLGDNDYTVTFDMNGHGTAVEAETVTEGSTATKPEAPTAEGFTFGGWYTEATCENAYDFATPVTADVTLYAKWTEDTDVEETAEWTFGNADNTVKEFDTSVLAETAIGDTGFKVATTVTKNNYNNVVVRNNASANSGYWPYTNPDDVGYYLFLGSGSSGTVEVTLALPKTVPAGKAINITFAKIAGTNKAGTNRGSGNPDNTITIGSKVLNLKSDYAFAEWVTKTVVADSDISSIKINLGAWGATGISKITVTDAPEHTGTEYVVVADATGNTTEVDCSVLVYNDDITGYRVTTSKDGVLVKQEIVKDAPTSVDSTGADKVEVTPVFLYNIGTLGEKGTAGAGYKIELPAGSYDFKVSGAGSRSDIYANDQMLVNNFLQNGTTPDWFAVKDIVITAEDGIVITSAENSGIKNVTVQVIKSSDIVNRVRKVYVLGDSLVAIYYNGGSKQNSLAQTGWGQVLQDYLKDVEVVDLANSGVTAQGLYDTAFSQVKQSAQPGDIFILESGYNDANSKNYGDTNPKEDYLRVPVRKMIEETPAGVDIILVSPNASAHDYKESVAWTSHMAALAEEKNVEYIDLSKLSYDFLYSLYKGSADAFVADYNVSDRLHSTYNAANKWASVVAGALYTISSGKYADIVNTDYVYTFIENQGNIISCSATGKTGEGYAKVTFSSNGKGAADSYKLVETGSKVEKPANPSASGYVFQGWYKDAEGTTEWNFDTDTVSADIIIYAKWAALAAGTLYTQDFTSVSAAADVATCPNAQDKLSIDNDEAHGNYLKFAGDSGTNSRGFDVNFTGADVSKEEAYVIEFDALLTPGNKDGSCFTVKGADFKYVKGVNDGPGSGYVINLASTGGGSTTYTLNGLQTIKINSGEWCHYKLYVDKDKKLVSTTITSESGILVDKVITPYNGDGNVAGIYVLAGRYSPVIKIDNILVREVDSAVDDFGTIVEEKLAGAEFSAGLNTIINQPAEGSATHKTITIKGKGSLGGDLTDKVDVVWTVVGLENEDGYISLTKASGTGAGTDGEAPDGTTAYFNVRNGVSNYFGYVQAVVSYGEDSYTIRTPFAVVGDTALDTNQLAPALGYPVCMDNYADSLIGYVGTANGINAKDVILNNWSIYGSNTARTLKLVEADGKKAIEFAANGGSGSTVAVYQWVDQTSQYVIDFTAKFTSDMAFGVYGNTPNNSDSNPEWTASFGSGALTLGSESIEGLNANTWYRIVVTADPSVQKVAVTVYDMDGTSLGEIKDIDMTNKSSVQKYFCFNGTWPMYLNTFKAYRPALETITVASGADTVSVPGAGEAAAEVDFSATLISNSGVQMTSTVDWSLAEEYANVELISTGAQTAVLKISAGASGTITVIATSGSKRAEKTIQLTTSSNVVAFTQSTSSITIPFAGEDDIVNNFVAVTRDGSGNVIDGGTITYTLLGKDGVTETTVKGVTFADGVLTVTAGASPAVVYVKAANGEGLSNTVKVNIHGLSFAFGSNDAAEGFTQVTDTFYTDKLGYGFAGTDNLTVNAANVTGTVDFRFKAKVPNGNYVVKVVTTSATILSEVVESVSAVTGITKSGNSFSVAVCDGVLDLTFLANSTVTSIEISQAAAKTALEKPAIYAIGDSTTKNDASGALSWGNCVAGGKVIVPSKFSGFYNHGMAGRDSVEYYNQGRVEAVLLAICPGDYVTVNMGINSKAEGEAAAYYTLLSEYYVEGILQRGGIPVIVTATPDGPVGDRLSVNYDSTTGRFTNSRGDGARNDVLRQIAKEKNLNIIELGLWGQNWMNSLTMTDVTAYNAANGTSYTTVLEMVQSWYVDHNHYKEYLGIEIGKYILDELTDLATDKVSKIYDFQNEVGANWGMTGDLSGSITIVEDSAVSGNKYLQLNKSEARNTTTTKVFEDMPKMTEATVNFRWYFGGQTSTNKAGFSGIKFMDGSTELISLYAGEMRNAGDTSALYVSTDGITSRTDTGVKVANGKWYDISIKFDFANNSATVFVDGVKAAAVSIVPIAQKVSAMAFVTFDLDGGTKVTIKMGIDDVEISYVEKTEEDDVVTIYSLGKINNVQVKAADWASYKHPESITALLSNAEEITVEIDAATWKCDNFDKNVKGAYTWTADIIAPAEYANDKGLKVSYVVEYFAESASGNHDYYNDFTFGSELFPSVAWGNGMSSTSPTGLFGFAHVVEADGNGYLNASVTGNGDRGSRLDLNSGIIKGATVTFDWMPINCNSNGNGQILFVSNSSWHSYFTLRFDNNYNIIAFTENPLGESSTKQEAFEGSIGADNPINTGLGGQNKWFTVSLTFDYLAHTADFTITDKANPENTFTRNDIPIDGGANGIRAIVMHMRKISNGASVAMGLDNIAVDYVKFGSNDIVKVTNPADVSVARSQYSEFEWAETANVELGNGDKIEIPISEWVATPEFNPDVAGQYVWTAELVTGEYTNYFNLNLKFTMTYTMLPYPTYVYNPPTLELKFNGSLPAEFPTKVAALMSNGEMGTVEVGEWTAIREFNASEEGIYVYGAKVIAKEGLYDVVPEKLNKNENPSDPSAQRKDYTYDVYYRISYYKDNNNYNGYARTMENLDRGVYAVAADGGVFVSWRILATEYGKDISFNVYRNGKLVTSEPITDKTNYLDAAGKAGDIYVVETVKDGRIYVSEDVTALKNNYLSIPVQKPAPQADKNGNLNNYTINDAGTADVDGDGQYEFIVKWYPDDAFDSGNAVEPSAPTIFDVYKMDGTPLWRLNLGLEMPSGAHFNQFMLYDLDEDGKAELFIKTSDGSVTYRPNAAGLFDMTDESTIVSYIGDTSVVPGTNVNSNGHMSKNTNEYVTVFNGMTGEEIDTSDFINTTGEYTEWGKSDGGNRSARYNIAIAYLPKDKENSNCTETIPAVLFNRGYYDKTTVAAYTLRNGKLELEWNFVTASGTEYAGKGNHNVSTGDIDKDGFDELVIGAMAIDHDGTVLWVKNGKDGQDYAGHADTIHLAAMNPDKNDLYVFTPQEETASTLNYSLVNAYTGTRYIGEWFTIKDVGRGVAANITPLPGYESWAAAVGSGIYAFDGTMISASKNLPSNWVLYWDGDLLSELGDGAYTDGDMVISKYNWETEECDTIETLNGTKTCNHTKKTPSLTADIFGDWREEVVMRNEDDTELRIYMTSIETDYMIYTLMHDPVYRNAVANQNTSYNQPPHVGIYLGEDQRDTVLNMQLATANIKYGIEDTVADVLNGTEPENILENIENIGVENMAGVMQNNQNVLDMVEEIEQKYVEDKGIEILAPEVEHKDISVGDIQNAVGVGLNAEENAKEIGLVFTEVEDNNKVEVDTDLYKNNIQIDIKLECDGVPVETKLKAPVTITMRIPSELVGVGTLIYHYHNENSYEIIKPTINADGSITFSVTSFSTFVFVKSSEPKEDPGDYKDPYDYYDADEENREYVESRWQRKEGWQKVDGKWYYFDASGSLKLGWVLDKDGRWYYMNKDGSMATKWVKSPASSLWYYMDPVNGHMLSEGWLCDPDSNRWYYLNENGAMCTSWIFVDNVWYLLDKNGAMCTGWNMVNGKWYLLDKNGAMLIGWQEVNGKMYFMKENGECLINTTTPDGFKVDESGAKIN